MDNLPPDIAREVSDCARQITMTKSLIQNAKDWNERVLLESQLAQHEEAMAACQLKVRGSWGT